LGPHPSQGAALQPGDVHLGVANLGGDGVLVQVLKEPHHDDLALQLRQAGDQTGQGQQVFWFLPGSGGGDQVAQTGVGVVAGWLVQGDPQAAAGRRQRLQDRFLGGVQVGGQLGDGAAGGDASQWAACPRSGRS
jgi:hypothetical protein